jgi:LDH2 family malate/lactate/ureidoglycolate dehydrogenase
VEADLMGLSSRGALRIPQYVRAGTIAPGAAIRIQQQNPTAALVDGAWNFSQVGAELEVPLDL